MVLRCVIGGVRCLEAGVFIALAHTHAVKRCPSVICLMCPLSARDATFGIHLLTEGINNQTQTSPTQTGQRIKGEPGLAELAHMWIHKEEPNMPLGGTGWGLCVL